MRAMVLAAGRGERMRPLTDRVPKPLLEVGGETLIERHLRAIAAAGLGEVLINLAWLGEQIVECIGDGAAYGLDITYAKEPEGALETGGGLYRALPWLGEGPFLVINADVWVDVDLRQWLAGTTLGPGDDGELMLVQSPPWKLHHDFGLTAGRVRREQLRYTFAGIAVYRASLLRDVDPMEAMRSPRFALAPCLFRAAEADRLAGRLHGGAWHDVGTPERLAALDAALTAR